VADDFRDIGDSGLGAVVVVSTTDWITYYANLGQYPMYRLGWGADYPDPYDFLAFLFHSGSAHNHTNYSSPQVDAWLDQAASTLNLVTRQALYQKVEARVQDDAPFINLYYGPFFVYHDSAVYVQGEDVLGLVIPPWWRPDTV
jgi:ABC-type transport system substrate-binding protein